MENIIHFKIRINHLLIQRYLVEFLDILFLKQVPNVFFKIKKNIQITCMIVRYLRPTYTVIQN